jgi:acetyltransferase-like isoleucine patch superfamily enzyme
MVMRSIANTALQVGRVWRRLRMVLLRPAFRRTGNRFLFDPDSVFTYGTIQVGDDVSIGSGATFIASESDIIIGSKVMFGPNVTIIGGDHNTSLVGKFMYDVTEKRPEDDQPVVVEDDVWVGAGATILKGVRLGRGCIVGAGSVVTKDIPPYTVVAGVPAKAVRIRFDTETILAHESTLYPPEQCLSRDQLERIALTHRAELHRHGDGAPS